MTDLQPEARRTPQSATRTRSGGYIATVVLAVVLAVFGLVLLGGGIWLITLGGSWYYAIAGLGLCITAWLLVRASMAALWIYLLTYVFTVIWALWEKGFDGWAQVPRLVAPTVVLILVLITIPVLRGPRQPRGTVAEPV
ncbi:glucose dehydrogenase [Celeribacter indicus]|uniref:Broad-specificity glycerol dehydrogenase, subunit SldA n=1 Tax=Celeribacter indicus TaxID=1208324 RepID=A0A0B5E9N0_9RHOB|nr:glucose dehydrogenase [Celeribacter indicus]AJE49052.1 broad-specificity glycerol dehydrogenase, subunit SldA [Celeribacter indicus]SDW44720.1 quinoprotein glucose dehydrogenase [Celeribacter indicus]